MRPENVQAFIDFFGFDPTRQALHTIGQAKVHNKMASLHWESRECLRDLELINEPYEEAMLAETWESPKLVGSDYLRAQALDQILDDIGDRIVRGTELAELFGFVVGTASFYRYQIERLSIHKEADQIVAKMRQQQ